MVMNGGQLLMWKSFVSARKLDENSISLIALPCPVTEVVRSIVSLSAQKRWCRSAGIGKKDSRQNKKSSKPLKPLSGLLSPERLNEVGVLVETTQGLGWLPKTTRT